MERRIYTIVVKKSAAKEIKRLPERYKDRIRDVVEALAHDPLPHGIEAIQGYDHHYRLRVGPYRIIYSVSKAEVLITVIRIGHRKDVYRDL